MKIGKKVKNFNLGQRLAVGADVGCGKVIVIIVKMDLSIPAI